MNPEKVIDKPKCSYASIYKEKPTKQNNSRLDIVCITKKEKKWHFDLCVCEYNALQHAHINVKNMFYVQLWYFIWLATLESIKSSIATFKSQKYFSGSDISGVAF